MNVSLSVLAELTEDRPELADSASVQAATRVNAELTDPGPAFGGKRKFRRMTVASAPSGGTGFGEKLKLVQSKTLPLPKSLLGT